MAVLFAEKMRRIALEGDGARRLVAPSRKDGRHRSGSLDVEVARAERFLKFESEWRDLVSRAWTPNVFMEPAVVAAAESEAASTHTLLVWATESDGCRRLVGVWAFAVAPAAPWFPMRLLRSPLNRHSHLGTPVVDRTLAREVISAMVEEFQRNANLPSVIDASDFEDGLLLELLLGSVRTRQLPWLVLDSRRRPRLDCECGPASYLSKQLSRSRLKRIARLRRRLEQLGRLEYEMVEEPDAVCVAFEKFLALESAGWKSSRIRRGHAFLLRPQWARVARDMIAGLAKERLVSIHILKLSGREIVMDVLLRSGAEAYTWRTAFDETLRSCGPGLVMLQDYTKFLLGDPTLAVVDSCNRRDTGIMAEFWAERRAVKDVLLCTGRNPFVFSMVAIVARVRYFIRPKLRSVRDKVLLTVLGVQGLFSISTHVILAA